MRVTLYAALVLTSVHPASAQLVPEGIHLNRSGPFTMCGFTAKNAQDLLAQVRASNRLTGKELNSPRFEAYVSGDQLTQLVFTKAGEPAYPAATCRHAYPDKDGAYHMGRNMRCEASREACDRLFLEFQSLDKRTVEEIRRQLAPKGD